MQNEHGIGRMERTSGAIQGQGEGERGRQPGAGMRWRLLTGAVLLALSSASWASPVESHRSNTTHGACAPGTIACGQDAEVAAVAPDADGATDVASSGDDANNLQNPDRASDGMRLATVTGGIARNDAAMAAALDDASAPYVAATPAAADIGTAAAVATGWGAVAIGSNAAADTNQYGTAVGAGSHAAGYSSLALGTSAATGSNAFGSVAIGLNAVANDTRVVSFGHAAGDSIYLAGADRTITFPSEDTRRLIHVAAGVNATDAVNKGQLDAAVGAVTVVNAVSYAAADKSTVVLAGNGGSVIDQLKAGDVSSAMSMQAVNGGQLYTTNQTVQANASALASHGTRLDADEAALADHDTRLVQDRGDIDAVTAGIGTINQTAVFYTDATRSQVQFGAGGAPVRLSNVAAGTAATDAVNKFQLDAVASQAGQTDASAVKYDDAAKGDITLAGGSGTAIHNLAAGSAVGDAVNKGQLDAVSGQVTAVGQRVDQVSQQVDANTTAIGQLDGRVGTLEGQVGALQQSTVTLTRVAVDGNTDGSDMATVQAGSHGVAVGANATAGGDHGTAIGGDSYAAGANDTALGGNAQVHADGSTAVGANAVVAAAATNAVAMGEGATVGAASGTALGQGSSVTAKGAVALGQGAVANQADTVSVGNATQQRRIVNVAAGTAGTDAVNVSQLDAGVQSAIEQGKAYSDANDVATLNSAKAYADQRFANASQQFDQFRDDVDRRFSTIDTRIDRLNAMGAASTQMAINAAGASGNGRLAAGVGFSGGRAAVSVGYGAPLGERTHISFGATSSGSESSGGIGFGVDL